jgi:hypothetical protein
MPIKGMSAALTKSPISQKEAKSVDTKSREKLGAGGSGRKQWENGGPKPTQGNSSRDPISKNPSQKRAGSVAQGAGPEFKSQCHQKKKKKEKKTDKNRQVQVKCGNFWFPTRPWQGCGYREG